MTTIQKSMLGPLVERRRGSLVRGEQVLLIHRGSVRSQVEGEFGSFIPELDVMSVYVGGDSYASHFTTSWDVFTQPPVEVAS